MTHLPQTPERSRTLALQDAAHALASWLTRVCRQRVYVRWTQNRSTMLSYRRGIGHISLRLHYGFVHAQQAELQAIADYIRGRTTQPARCLDAFITTQLPRLSRPPPRHQGSAKGAIYDLSAIFSLLNRTYFHGGCTARIVWGRAHSRRGPRRSIQLGCYVFEDNLIRMHPCLDQTSVPHYFVAGVVFHEMLHEVFGIGHCANRRVLHPADFLAVEQSHPDYARCQAWQRQHLTRLLQWRP